MLSSFFSAMSKRYFSTSYLICLIMFISTIHPKANSKHYYNACKQDAGICVPLIRDISVHTCQRFNLSRAPAPITWKFAIAEPHSTSHPSNFLPSHPWSKALIEYCWNTTCVRQNDENHLSISLANDLHSTLNLILVLTLVDNASTQGASYDMPSPYSHKWAKRKQVT